MIEKMIEKMFEKMFEVELGAVGFFNTPQDLNHSSSWFVYKQNRTEKVFHKLWDQSYAFEFGSYE